MKRDRALQEIVECLKSGGVGVIPTDTVYGLAASAFSPEATERIYFLKNRNSKKPFVILISSLDELLFFGVKASRATLEILRKIWPRKISVILPCAQKRFFYLHRGAKSLAFRIPHDKRVINLIKKTGPLASSSANISGMRAARTLKEAKKYFRDQVDFYVNGGELDFISSTLIKIQRGKIFVKRKGAEDIQDALGKKREPS